jgi:hypothetical protein
MPLWRGIGREFPSGSEHSYDDSSANYGEALAGGHVWRIPPSTT